MIAVDVESSGTNASAHSILSIGALDLDEPTNQFYEECKVWDGAHIEEAALTVNGFSREEAKDESKQSEADLMRSFTAWATDRPKTRTLVAHNVSFDFSFLQAAAKRGGEDFPFPKRTIDIHSLVWLHMVRRGMEPPAGEHRSLINFDFALRYCGIPEEPFPHNALTGALSHAEVFSRIAYNKKLLPDFSLFDIPWTPTV